METAPRLTVVVPVYNEEATLPEIIDRLIRACGSFSEFIFVDDGSTDSTLAILRTHARPADVVLSEAHAGKGAAVRAGIARAHGTYFIVQDADCEYSPEEIPSLLAFAEQRHLPVVFGSRRLKEQRQYVHLSSFIGGSLLTYICNALYGLRLTDQPTCYKLVAMDVLRTLPLTERDFRFEPELTALLARRNIPIAEYPISYRPRSFAEGKKVRWNDWLPWVWVFVRLRFARIPPITLEKSSAVS